MSSFYAGIMGGSISGSDYNNLVNVPIQNIGNKDSGVTNLSTLTTGHYNLLGAYTISTESSEEYANKSELDVLVLNDTIRDTHIVQFITVEEGQVYINILTYQQDGSLVDSKKISLTAPSHSSWGEI